MKISPLSIPPFEDDSHTQIGYMHPWWFRDSKDRAQDRVGKLEAEAKAVELQQAVECASFWTESMELQIGGFSWARVELLKK